MKNLTIIYKKDAFSSISNLKKILSAGAYLIRGDYALDATHTLSPEENALLIVSTRKGQNEDKPRRKFRHSLVICSQGGFYDDQMMWGGEDIKSLQQAVATLQETKQDRMDMNLVEFTNTTLSNKAHLDAYLAKLPNAKVMHCTYNGEYAGTLHKINGSWYGVLVSESNTLAGQLSIKLQADGTIVEGTA